MLNRIYYVLLTYVTRPAFWVLGGLYVVAVIFAANSDVSRSSGRSVAPGPPNSFHTLFLSDPESIQKFDEGTFDRNIRAVAIYWHNENVEGLKAERILPDGRRELLTFPAFSAKHLQQLRECPRLKTLTLQHRGRLTDGEWQALGDLDQITALKYDGEISPLGMRQIARLSKLRFLDLSVCTFDEGLEGLESLEHLQTVVLENFVEKHVHVLGELRRLPHLRVLVATNYRTADPNVTSAVWEADLGALQAVTSLERWFVDDTAPGFPGFDALASELPHVAIRPTQVAAARELKWIPVILLTGLMICLLFMQFNSHFAHPGARLTPGYVVAHLIPATILWLCGLLIPAWFLASAASPILPLVGISMAIWLGVASLVLGLNRVGRRIWKSPQRRSWIVVPVQIVAAFWFPLLLLVTQFKQSAFDWFLRGQAPGLAITIIAAGVLCYVIFVRQVCSAQVEFQESGMGTPPLGLQYGLMAAYVEQSAWRQRGGAGKSWYSFDRRLDRAIKQGGQPGWRRRSNLWIAGNRMNGKHSLLIGVLMTIMMCCGSLTPQIWGGLDFDIAEMFADSLGPPAAMTMLLFPDFCFMTLGIVWRGRRRWLPMESLRPVSRQKYVRESMTAFAWDCVPPSCVYIAVVAAFTHLANPAKWSPVWTIALSLYLAAHVATACGIISWLNTIRRDWVTVFAVIATGYAFLFAGAGSALMFLPGLGITELPPDLPNLPHWLLLGIGLIWGLVAAAVIKYAYHRWMNVELGDYAG